MDADQATSPPQDQTPITVQVDGLGPVQFPAGTSRDVMETAINARLAQQHVNNQTDVPHPIVQRILKALPAAFGPLGYFFGTEEGRQQLPTAGGITGGMLAGPTGAAAGAAAGTAARDITNAATGQGDTPKTAMGAATDVVGQSALQGGLEGTAALASRYAKPVAERLMQSAVKPGFQAIEDMVNTGNAPKVVQTLLKDGINVTASGIRRLNALIATDREQVKSILTDASGQVDPMQALGPLKELAGKYKNQPTPQADLATIRQAANDFIDAWVKDPQSGEIMAKWSPAEAQEVKTGAYRKVQGDFGQMSGAAKDSQKALARGIKEGIENAVPNSDVAAINAREGARIDALDVVGRRWAMAHNLEPAGLAPVANKAAGFFTMLAQRSPAVKSMLANGLYKQAALVTGVPVFAIRAMMAAISGAQGDQP